tara:strand:- start:984 stop:1679 length:696 start_codon:yes stop_codon:yes gene_type:complete
MRNRLTKYFWSKINSIYYRGNNIICPLCNWKGLEFVNGRCPKCNSLPRQRLIPVCINDLQPKRNKILHIAPNPSEYFYVKNTLKPNVYDRVDILKGQHINIVQDITKKGLNDNYYDLIIVWHVFEHIVDDLTAIQNLSTSLNQRGSLLVSVPIYPRGNKKTFEDQSIPQEKYKKIHGHPDHYRSCGYDYWERFLDFGLTKMDCFDVKKLGKSKIDLYGLSINHISWLFHKS